MFKKIMVPVDLEHVAALKRALTVAADMAKPSGATIVYVGVSSSAPGSVAHNPAEFRAKLEAFAKSQAVAHDVTTQGHAMISHDPSVDLDPTLLKAAEDIAADLIVMQSHVPGLADHLWSSNAGKIARYATCSVLVVRD